MNLLFPIQHASDLEASILSMLRCYNSVPYGIQRRLKAILKINKSFNMSAVAKQLNVSCGFITKWRDRAMHFFSTWPTEPTDVQERMGLLIEAFADAPRSGAPAWYTAEELCHVMALALKKPTDCDREITHWTNHELADEVNEQEITIRKISKSTVGRLLKDAVINHIIRFIGLTLKLKMRKPLKKRLRKFVTLITKQLRLPRKMFSLYQQTKKQAFRHWDE